MNTQKRPALLFRHPRLFRFALTWFGPYWGTGIRVSNMTNDFSRIEVQMRRTWFNGNAFGTHFGGSLYAMCDPFYCLMLVARLGPAYVVWDQSAHIDFVKPGKGTMRAVFEASDDWLNEIRDATASGQKALPQREVLVLDESGDVVARIQKTLYVRLKRPSSSRPPSTV